MQGTETVNPENHDPQLEEDIRAEIQIRRLEQLADGKSPRELTQQELKALRGRVVQEHAKRQKLAQAREQLDRETGSATSANQSETQSQKKQREEDERARNQIERDEKRAR